MGLGLGLVFAPAMSTATLGVDRRDAGVASAMVNTGAAGRRLDRHRAAEHARRERGDLGCATPRPQAADLAAGRRPRLHHRVLLGRPAIFAVGAPCSRLLLPPARPSSNRTHPPNWPSLTEAAGQR